MSCSAKTSKGTQCKHKARSGQTLCTLHFNRESSSSCATHTNSSEENSELISASTGRYVAPLTLFDSNKLDDWEKAYIRVMDKKYQKGTRGYSKKITGIPFDEGSESPIFLIPRQRGGPSYKDVQLEGVDTEDVQFCCISKGFGMQDVSSFTLGPIVGEGLCLVNAAYSKSICIMHLVGGGKVNYARKNFWKPGTPVREIEVNSRAADANLLSTVRVTSDTTMMVKEKDETKAKKWVISEWLEKHKSEWYDEWLKWSRSIAASSVGCFHWTDSSPVVTYLHHDKYLCFVDWKKQCYILPSIALLEECSTYKFLERLFKERIPLGLVHPKSPSDEAEKPVTREHLRMILDSPEHMTCQPLVIAIKLLGVDVYEKSKD